MTLSRRALLKGLGAAAAGLPLLSSLAPRRARAVEQAPPKRFVVVFHPNGVVPETWHPAPGASETDFVLNRAHEPLQAFRDRLLVLKGVDLLSGLVGPGEPHQRGMGALLTGRSLNEGGFVGGDGSLAGFAKGISVDQRIAQHVGASTRFRSLELGVRADVATTTAEVRSRLVYAGDAQPLPPSTDPRQVYARLFSSADGAGVPPEVLLARRRSVLDAVKADFARLSAQLPGEERRRLEAHLSLVRDLEQRLSADLQVDGCTAPPPPPELLHDDESTMQHVSRLMIDLLVAALSCDQTRVASLQYSNALNHIRFPWLPSMGDGHGLSHAGPSALDERDQLVRRDRWYAGEIAYLLSRLDEVQEGDGTLLDSTLVLWVSELSVGNLHSQRDMPFVLAGSAGGAIRTGRLLSFEHASHNDLLLAILRAYGVEDTTFGDPDFCAGPLPGVLA